MEHLSMGEWCKALPMLVRIEQKVIGRKFGLPANLMTSWISSLALLRNVALIMGCYGIVEIHDVQNCRKIRLVFVLIFQPIREIIMLPRVLCNIFSKLSPLHHHGVLA